MQKSLNPSRFVDQTSPTNKKALMLTRWFSVTIGKNKLNR